MQLAFLFVLAIVLWPTRVSSSGDITISHMVRERQTRGSPGARLGNCVAGKFPWECYTRASRAGKALPSASSLAWCGGELPARGHPEVAGQLAASMFPDPGLGTELSLVESVTSSNPSPTFVPFSRLGDSVSQPVVTGSHGLNVTADKGARPLVTIPKDRGLAKTSGSTSLRTWASQPPQNDPDLLLAGQLDDGVPPVVKRADRKRHNANSVEAAAAGTPISGPKRRVLSQSPASCPVAVPEHEVRRAGSAREVTAAGITEPTPHAFSAPIRGKPVRVPWTCRWPDQELADLLRIYREESRFKGSLCKRVEDRWVVLHPQRIRTGSALVSHANKLVAKAARLERTTMPEPEVAPEFDQDVPDDAAMASDSLITQDMIDAFHALCESSRNFAARRPPPVSFRPSPEQLGLLDELVKREYATRPRGAPHSKTWAANIGLLNRCVFAASRFLYQAPVRNGSLASLKAKILTVRCQLAVLDKVIGLSSGAHGHKPTRNGRTKAMRRLYSDYRRKGKKQAKAKRAELVATLRKLQSRLPVLRSEEGGKEALPPTGPSREQLTAYWSAQMRVAEPMVRLKGNPALRVARAWGRKRVGRDADTRKIEITDAQWKAVFQALKSNKAPGPDQIRAYWWRSLPYAKSVLRKFVRAAINGKAGRMRRWMAEGQTTMIFKGDAGASTKEELTDPGKWRPICCLNTFYKILTATIRVLLNAHVEEFSLLPDSQCGIGSKRRGTADCQLWYSTLCEHSRRFKRPLSVAWLDFRAAFPSIPHRVLLQVLRAFRVPERIRNCLGRLMPLWRTRISLSTKEGRINTPPIPVKRGFLQGDPLSPLVFSLTIAAVQIKLDALSPRFGYAFGQTDKTTGEFLESMSSRWYLDDSLILGKGPAERDSLVETVKEYSAAVGMTCNPSKCAVADRGRHVKRAEEHPAREDGFSILGEDDFYKYLGINQLFNVDPKAKRQELEEWAIAETRSIFNGSFGSRAAVDRYNARVVGKFRYSIAANMWSWDSLRQMDKVLKQEMVNAGAHIYEASTDRLYLPSEMGGRGLTSLEDQFFLELMSLYAYVWTNPSAEYKLLRAQLLLLGESASARANSFVQRIEAAYARIEADLYPGTEHPSPIRQAVDEVIERYNEGSITGQRAREDIAGLVKVAVADRRVNKFMGHDIVPEFYKNSLILPEGMRSEPAGRGPLPTYAWMKTGCLSLSQEAIIVAAQDGTVRTRAYKDRLRKRPGAAAREQPSNPLLFCELCHGHPESLAHILAGCPVHRVDPEWKSRRKEARLPKNGMYMVRHDAVALELYRRIARHNGLKANTGAPVEDLHMDMGGFSIHWNKRWDAEGVKHTRPDIVTVNHSKRRIKVIEVSIPLDNNIHEMRKQKKLRYELLCGAFERMHPGYIVECIPIVMGALGRCTYRTQRSIARLTTGKGTITQAARDHFIYIQSAGLKRSAAILRQHLAISSRGLRPRRAKN